MSPKEYTNRMSLGDDIKYWSLHIDGNEYQGIGDFEADFTKVGEYIDSNTYIKLVDPITVTCSIDIDRQAILILCGYYDWVMKYCPNRRAVHLATYGRTRRIRNKNFKRAEKILSTHIKKGRCN